MCVQSRWLDNDTLNLSVDDPLGRGECPKCRDTNAYSSAHCHPLRSLAPWRHGRPREKDGHPVDHFPVERMGFPHP